MTGATSHQWSVVGEVGLVPTISCSQSTCVANYATPRRFRAGESHIKLDASPKGLAYVAPHAGAWDGRSAHGATISSRHPRIPRPVATCLTSRPPGARHLAAQRMSRATLSSYSAAINQLDASSARNTHRSISRQHGSLCSRPAGNRAWRQEARIVARSDARSSLDVAAGRGGASRSGCHRGGVSSSGKPAPTSNRPVTMNRSMIPDAPLAATRRRRTTIGRATTAIEPANSTKNVRSNTMGSSFAPPGFMGGFAGLSTGQGANRHRVWSILGTAARPRGESFDTPRGEGR